MLLLSCLFWSLCDLPILLSLKLGEVPIGLKQLPLQIVLGITWACLWTLGSGKRPHGWFCEKSFSVQYGPSLGLVHVGPLWAYFGSWHCRPFIFALLGPLDKKWGLMDAMDWSINFLISLRNLESFRPNGEIQSTAFFALHVMFWPNFFFILLYHVCWIPLFYQVNPGNYMPDLSHISIGINCWMLQRLPHSFEHCLPL